MKMLVDLFAVFSSCTCFGLEERYFHIWLFHFKRCKNFTPLQTVFPSCINVTKVVSRRRRTFERGGIRLDRQLVILLLRGHRSRKFWPLPAELLFWKIGLTGVCWAIGQLGIRLDRQLVLLLLLQGWRPIFDVNISNSWVSNWMRSLKLDKLQLFPVTRAISVDLVCQATWLLVCMNPLVGLLHCSVF